MASLGEQSVIFSDEDRAAFEKYACDSPNTRRSTPARKDVWLHWLASSDGRSLNQREHNQRHYVRKTFALDSSNQQISTQPRDDEECARLVVTTDMIVDVIELVHVASGHRGWDATWKDISSSDYGILREDVIFLLRRWHVCLRDPRKRPKSGAQIENKD
jgi:hypothetical protein